MWVSPAEVSFEGSAKEIKRRTTIEQEQREKKKERERETKREKQKDREREREREKERGRDIKAAERGREKAKE